MDRETQRRILGVGALIYVSDQLTKLAVLRWLGPWVDEREVIAGFFKLVHWGNTGAAWSLFSGNNELLAFVSIVALVVLFLTRDRFEIHTRLGQIALGLILGGILGNLTDRLRVGHVVDFIRFYVDRRGGGEVGFPAFNVADSSICVGVGLLFLLSARAEPRPSSRAPLPGPA